MSTAQLTIGQAIMDHGGAIVGEDGTTYDLNSGGEVTIDGERWEHGLLSTPPHLMDHYWSGTDSSDDEESDGHEEDEEWEHISAMPPALPPRTNYEERLNNIIENELRVEQLNRLWIQDHPRGTAFLVKAKEILIKNGYSTSTIDNYLHYLSASHILERDGSYYPHLHMDNK